MRPDNRLRLCCADSGVYSEQNDAGCGWLSGHNLEQSSARFGGPDYLPIMIVRGVDHSGKMINSKTLKGITT